MTHSHKARVGNDDVRTKALRRIAALIAVAVVLVGAITPRPLESSSKTYLAEPVYGDGGEVMYWICKGRCISRSPQCCEVFPRPY